MLVMIDNYDSFTWNLMQMIGTLEPDLKLFRNDEISLEQLEALHPDGLLISPGPGRPEDAGEILHMIRAFAGRIPILGICLGHQAICQAYGATITYAKTLMHGKRSVIDFDERCPLFASLSAPCTVGRYHSLAAEASSLPDSLQCTARSEDGEIMAVMDQDNDVYGLQFHPESILSDQGFCMLSAFVDLVHQRARSRQPDPDRNSCQLEPAC